MEVRRIICTLSNLRLDRVISENQTRAQRQSNSQKCFHYLSDSDDGSTMKYIPVRRPKLYMLVILVNTATDKSCFDGRYARGNGVLGSPGHRSFL